MKYAILSDIHEDIVSLRLAFNKIEKLRCEEIICLGDISGFSSRNHNHFDTRNASESLRLIRENCSIIIAGNHDLYSAQKIPEIVNDFTYPFNWYSLDYPSKKALSEDKVWLYEKDELNHLYAKSDIDFLQTIPEFVVLNTNGENVFLSHYIYPNISGSDQGFYSRADEFELHKVFMKKHKCNFSFAGHRHYLGLYIASNNKIIEKRFDRKYLMQEDSCVLIPPIVGNSFGNGFCVFDSVNQTVEAKRI